MCSTDNDSSGEFVMPADGQGSVNNDLKGSISTDLTDISSTQKYEDEWKQLFDNCTIKVIQDYAQKGYLRASRFRSVCWRVLLEILSTKTLKWVGELRKTRCLYRKLKNQLTSNPQKNKDCLDDPLSQDSQSIWNQYFCDQELRAVIRQDVVRTFPGVDFFRKGNIQQIMVDILFVYARERPVMCYRQGMHEILAPLLFVLHCDHQAMNHMKEQGNVSLLIEEVLSSNWLEEDGYTIFLKIMEGIEFCYKIKDLRPTKTGYFPASTLTSPLNESPTSNHHENEVVVKLNWIHNTLLRPTDPELYRHLNNLDIPLPLFGIRWLRLLFGREFPLQDLLVLWDAIFSEGPTFEFLNYVVVAMLVAIRSQLINSDYTNCLTYLMRYPTVVDISNVIDYALHLKSPEIHALPEVILKTPTNEPAIQETNKIQNNNTQKNSKASHKKVVENRVNKLNHETVVDEVEQILEGLSLNDPVMLKQELFYAQNIMEVCHHKLRQYHKILMHFIPNDSSFHEVHNVLDGIDQLCHLLNNRQYKHIYADVEPALEAGESKLSPIKSPNFIDLTSNLKLNIAVAKNNVKDKPLKVFSQLVGKNGSVIEGAPVTDPLYRIKNGEMRFPSIEFLFEAVEILNAGSGVKKVKNSTNKYSK